MTAPSRWLGLAGGACWLPALAQVGAAAAFDAAVAAHDASAYALSLHPGAIFDAGASDAPRGAAAVGDSWSEIVAGTAIALRCAGGQASSRSASREAADASVVAQTMSACASP